MAEAPHDQNFVRAKLGVLFSDGVTLVPIALNPSTNAVKVNTTDTISQAAIQNAPRDGNYGPAWLGQNDTTGFTMPIYVDANGAVLIRTS